MSMDVDTPGYREPSAAGGPWCCACGGSAMHPGCKNGRTLQDIPASHRALVCNKFPRLNGRHGPFTLCNTHNAAINKMLPKKVNNGGKKRGRPASHSTESSPAGDQEPIPAPSPPETTEVEQGSGTERPAADTGADDARPATRPRREHLAAATPEVNHTPSPACRHVSYLVSLWLLSTTTLIRALSAPTPPFCVSALLCLGVPVPCCELLCLVLTLHGCLQAPSPGTSSSRAQLCCHSRKVQADVWRQWPGQERPGGLHGVFSGTARWPTQLCRSTMFPDARRARCRAVHLAARERKGVRSTAAGQPTSPGAARPLPALSLSRRVIAGCGEDTPERPNEDG